MAPAPHGVGGRISGTDSLLEIERGTFGYGKRPPILREVSVRVSAGRLLAVLSPNGAGKTTLLRCLLGPLPWRSGCTRLDGRDITEMGTAERWRRFAFVPQAPNAVTLSVTGLEMVSIGRAAHLGPFAQPGRADLAIARGTMERIGIPQLAEMPCGQMSGGQFQMVLIARVLATRPQVLVLDEPETGLALRYQLVVLDLLDQVVHEDGVSVVMNTHDPTHALRVADDVLLLPRGGEPLVGDAQEVVTAQNLERILGVQVVLMQTTAAGREHRSVLPVALA